MTAITRQTRAGSWTGSPELVRSVRSGLAVAWLGTAVLLVLPFLPGTAPLPLVPYFAVLAYGSAVTAVLEYLQRTRPGEPIYHRWIQVWIANQVPLFTTALAAVGAGSELFFVYLLASIFYASVLSTAWHLATTGASLAGYVLVVLLQPGEVRFGTLALRATLLAAGTVMAAQASSVLRREIAARQRAHAESERRATLLRTVATSARRMSSLDPRDVLEEVTAAVVSLGFEVAGIALPDWPAGSFSYAATRGVARELLGGVHPISSGASGTALREGHTVVIYGYGDSDQALGPLQRSDLRVAISTPVWSRGRITAALTGATTDDRVLTDEDRETMELLAGLAGRALENAHLFEQEHETVQRLTELDQMKSDFLGTVSHELRTPLTVIRGLTETLRRHYLELDDETRQHFIGRAEANAATLDEVITTLLDFGRLESGHFELVLGPVDVERLVHQVTTRLSPLLADHHVNLALEEGLAVHADALLLERVVENLLSNAAKYTPAGGAISIKAHSLGNSGLILVADDGPGIPEEIIGRVGERFFRGGDPNTRGTRGVGLGLAFVREVLALHDSQLEIASRVGAGSRFAFRLPLATDSPRVAGTPSPLHAATELAR